MAQAIETIDVEVPVRTAYDQWTQFEEFPKFLDEVESITQTTVSHTDTGCDTTPGNVGVRTLAIPASFRSTAVTPR